MSGLCVGAHLYVLADMITLSIMGVDLDRLFLLFRGIAVTRYLAGSAGGGLRDAHAHFSVAHRGHYAFMVDCVMVDCIQMLFQLMFPLMFSHAKITTYFLF